MSSSPAQHTGRVVFEGAMASKVLGTRRTVRICVPPSYDGRGARRFPVLYVHDGQNAFSTVGDYVAFGWGNWQLDRTAAALSATGQMQEIMIVAVDCSAERYEEYRGPADRASDRAEGQLATEAGWDSPFERYHRFLIDELKPFIDREYRTQSGPEHTALLGSSMGGLCSLALAWVSPHVFGGAASLSGAFQVERRKFLVKALRGYRGTPKAVRVYLDSGVVDYSGGDDGRKHTEAVAQELRRIGWRDGADLMYFLDEHPLDEAALARTGLPREKWKEAQTSQHNEFYWRLRAWRPLTFLFPGRAEGTATQ